MSNSQFVTHHFTPLILLSNDFLLRFLYYKYVELKIGFYFTVYYTGYKILFNFRVKNLIGDTIRGSVLEYCKTFNMCFEY